VPINQITKPYTFANGAGNYADAAQVNQNFDTIVSKINEIVSALNLAAGSKPSLDDRLDMAIAADGTPLEDATAGGAWIALPTHAATYVGAYEFTVEGDHTDIYLQYRRLCLTCDGSDVFSEVASSSYSGVTGLTTVYLLDSVLVSPITSVKASSCLPDTATGTNVSPRGITPITIATSASESAAGKVELSTNAEALTGTDTARATTPANVKHVLDNRPATDSGTGLVELATAAEVLAGTDEARAATPAGIAALVASLVASESAKGLVELATAEEVLAGTDTTKAMTAAGFAGNKSIGTNEHYYWFPGGILIQWGATASISNNSGRDITFPVGFPTECLGVFIGGGASSDTGDTIILQRNVTTTGFRMVNGGPTPSGNHNFWFSIGR